VIDFSLESVTGIGTGIAAASCNVGQNAGCSPTGATPSETGGSCIYGDGAITPCAHGTGVTDSCGDGNYPYQPGDYCQGGESAGSHCYGGGSASGTRSACNGGTSATYACVGTGGTPSSSNPCYSGNSDLPGPSPS